MARQTLDQWVREALIDPDKDGKCTSMSLVHMQGQNEKELHTVRFGPKPWDPKELASLFRGKAESYASDITGVQTFNLLAFYDNRNEPQARKPFIIHGENDYGGLATEPPTKEGQTMQGMRHMEAVIQLAFRQTAMLFESSNQTIKSLVEQNAQLMRENRDGFDIVKELMIKQIEGDHKHRMEQLQYERSTRERAKWLGMAPALVNTLTGKPIFPQGNEDTALIESVVDSLDEDAIQKLATIIKPEVWAPLASRMANHLRQRREAHGANGVDPEDDTVGGPQ